MGAIRRAFKLRRVLIGVVVTPIVIAAIILIAFRVFLGDPTCDGDDPDANAVRSFPRERYRQIFEYVRAKAPWPRDLYEANVPSQLSDLGVKVLRTGLEPGAVTLRIRGCLDHHLDLMVLGADASVDGGPRIELRYGEWNPVSEVLWKPEPEDPRD